MDYCCGRSPNGGHSLLRVKARLWLELLRLIFVRLLSERFLIVVQNLFFIVHKKPLQKKVISPRNGTEMVLKRVFI